MPFLLIQTNSYLPCAQIEMKQSEEKLLIKSGSQGINILNTKDEAFPEVEEGDERPHIDKDFLIPTDD